MIRRIDPAHAQWPEQFILAQYIKQNPHLVFVPKSADFNKPYSILTDHGRKKEFYLEKSILRRERKNGKSGYRYEVIGKVLGRGTSGTVCEVLATLVLDGDYLHPTAKLKSRVVKISEKNAFESVEDESAIATQIPHLHAKKSTLVKEKDLDLEFMVSKRQPGRSLEEVLKIEKLTTEKKLHLLLALSKALKKQVWDNGLVHRDIKPANIMVNFISGNPIPTIIDFEFAKRIGDESGELAGTPLYLPPEVLEWVSNSGAYSTYPCHPVMDIYALSKVACDIFAENYSFNEQMKCDLSNLAEKLCDGGLLEEEIKWLVDLSINDSELKKKADLSAAHRERFIKLIQKMGSYYPSQRASIELAIEELSIICQERVLPSKLNYLKQLYPVYQILSSYPQLFAINKICIESDEKKINRYLQPLLPGRADLALIEKEVDQITKAWHTIKKSNESPAFNAIFSILTRCLAAHEDKSTKNEFEVKTKRRIVTYIKTHMRDLITNQDAYAVKRLKAISNFLDDLEKNPTPGKGPQATLEKNLSIILTRQFNTSALHLCKNDVANQRYIPRVFFAKPRVSYDSGIEINMSMSEFMLKPHA